MNEYDSNRILDLVKKINYEPVSDLKKADCYILNTCHIREKATEKVYHDVGRVKKEFKFKKKPILIVAGCVAQAEGDILLKREKYIDATIGPQSYHKINNIIQSIEKKNTQVNSTNFEVIEKFDKLNIIKNTKSNVSSFLTIQEGCDKFCKFCVVPYTRGPEYSRSSKEIVSEAKHLVDNGSKEIILLGQNVNAYNNDNIKLADLIFSLAEIKELKRIRYTTSHPKDFNSDLIEAHAVCDKLMPLLHLPVQSGSTSILKKMNRGHTADEYLELINKLKKEKPTIKFSSDFIIGYPGETKDDYIKTIELLKKIKFINSFSFIFSPRPGTPAAKLEEINKKTAKERLFQFQNIANKIKSDYRKSLINTTTKVLFENKAKEINKYFGRDEYFNSVIVTSDEDLTGQIRNIKINKCNHNTLFGSLVLGKQYKDFAA